MPTVRLRDPSEYPEDERRAMKRAKAPGEFGRAEKEMVAAAVSGVNACRY